MWLMNILKYIEQCDFFIFLFTWYHFLLKFIIYKMYLKNATSIIVKISQVSLESIESHLKIYFFLKTFLQKNPC